VFAQRLAQDVYTLLGKNVLIFIGRGQRIHLVDEETPQTVGDDLLFYRGLTQIPGDQIVSRNLFERSLLRIPILEYIRPIILAISVFPVPGGP
jgi:hypothetical protein